MIFHAQHRNDVLIKKTLNLTTAFGRKLGHVYFWEKVLNRTAATPSTFETLGSQPVFGGTLNTIFESLV